MIVEVIGRLRELVDKAIDWLIGKAITLGKAALNALGLGRKEEPKPDANATSELTVTKPVTMASASHTLTFKVIKGKPVVFMASRFDVLMNLTIGGEKQEKATPKPRPEVLDPLDKIYKKLKDLEEEWVANQGKSTEEITKRAEIGVWLSFIADQLQGIGKDAGIKSLEDLGHASKYVEGNTLKPEYQDVRANFYPSGYWTTTELWLAGRLTALENRVNPAQFRDELTGGWEPKSEATIDHKPMVWQHWNDDGRLLRQPKRIEFYNDTPKLKVVAFANNASDGAKAKAMGAHYVPTVGTDFRGPADSP